MRIDEQHLQELVAAFKAADDAGQENAFWNIWAFLLKSGDIDTYVKGKRVEGLLQDRMLEGMERNTRSSVRNYQPGDVPFIPYMLRAWKWAYLEAVRSVNRERLAFEQSEAGGAPVNPIEHIPDLNANSDPAKRSLQVESDQLRKEALSCLGVDADELVAHYSGDQSPHESRRFRRKVIRGGIEKPIGCSSPLQASDPCSKRREWLRILMS